MTTVPSTSTEINLPWNANLAIKDVTNVLMVRLQIVQLAIQQTIDNWMSSQNNAGANQNTTPIQMLA